MFKLRSMEEIYKDVMNSLPAPLVEAWDARVEYNEILAMDGALHERGDIKINEDGSLSYAPPQAIKYITMKFTIKNGCEHDPNDTGFNFAYCKKCDAKLKRGPNLEWID